MTCMFYTYTFETYIINEFVKIPISNKPLTSIIKYIMNNSNSTKFFKIHKLLYIQK
jgi:hypothetical protein